MRKVLLSRISFSALMLTFLTLFLFFSFSSSLEISQWNKGNPSGNITNEYINNTYINQTLELNETQFETGEPVTIKTSWLTTFIESVSKWANYYTKSEIDNRYSNNTGDQDLSTYVQGNMSSETYNETIITPTTNYSLSFDGVNDYVTLNSNFGLSGTRQVTFSAWINNTKNFVGWSGIITDATDNSNDLALGAWDNAGMGYYLTTEVTNAHTGLVNSTGWHLLTGTYDGTYLKIYYDGVLKDTATDTTTTITSENFQIGRDRNLPRYWKGSIDEVLIFNRSLNSTEISDLYNLGRGIYASTSIAPFNDGLVAGYHFDEGTGTTAYDITGRNNGTLINGPTWVDGKISHNLTSTTETLGAKGLMPWVSATNFISTDFSLQWIGNTLKNPWFTSTELGNSTNRWNIFAWDTETVNLNVTNQTTMNNLTVNNLNVTNSFTGNCVNASILNGIIVGCND